MRRQTILRRALAALVAAGVAALLPGGRAVAHPADMYAQAHEVTLSAGGISVHWTIYPGPLLTPSIWSVADADSDGAISEDEARVWLAPAIQRLSARVDGGTPLRWEVEQVAWPASFDAFQLGDERISLVLAAAWPERVAAAHTLLLHNTFEDAISTNWFSLTGEEGITFSTPVQSGGRLEVPFALAGTRPGGEGDPRSTWDSGMPSLPVSGSQPTLAQVVERETGYRRITAALTGLVRSGNLSAGFYAFALGVALVLGAIHALTPGHGKALVAAYLVGSRGTLRHAAALGGIVTATHTGSVIGLGALTLAASRFLVPTTLFPLLEMASGLLIVGLGASLLIRRWRGYRSVAARRAEARQKAESLLPDAAEDSPAAPPDGRQRVAVGASIPVRVYDDVLPGGAGETGGIRWRSLVGLGVSGGLVPCPDAIAILLVAIAINRVALGLSLVVAFSAGLAAVLIAIGIAMVRSRRLVERLGGFERMAPALPVASAAIVLGLGAYLTTSAALRAGLFRQADGVAQAAEFDLQTARVLYLAPDAEQHMQVWRIGAAGGTPEALTADPYGVRDFALAPDHTRLIYAVVRADSSGELWELPLGQGGDARRLLECSDALCGAAQWGPRGAGVIYERVSTRIDDPLLGASSLWWLDVTSGDTSPLFRDAALPGHSPRWAPDGQSISYLSTSTPGLQVYNLATGERAAVPSQAGGAAVWAPEGDALLLFDMRFSGERFASHLLRYDLASGTLTDLTTLAGYDDRGAAWAPDGSQIAVLRAQFSATGAARGDQIWLMDREGGNAQQISAGDGLVHGTPAWSPNGRTLLFHQYSLEEAWAQPSVMLLDVESGDLRLVVKPGYGPVWLP